MSDLLSLSRPTSASPDPLAASRGVPGDPRGDRTGEAAEDGSEDRLGRVRTLQGDLVEVRVEAIGWRTPMQLLWMLPIFAVCLGGGMWANAHLIGWRLAHRAANESAARLMRIAPQIAQMPPESLLDAARGWWTTVRAWPDANRPAIVRTTGVALTRRFDALLRSTAQITPLQEVFMVAAWDSVSAETVSDGALDLRREAARTAALARGSEAVLALARAGATLPELRDAEILAGRLVDIAPPTERAAWERAHLTIMDRMRRVVAKEPPGGSPAETQQLGEALTQAAGPPRELRDAFVARSLQTLVTAQSTVRTLRTAGPAGTQLQIVGRATSALLLQSLFDNASLRERLTSMGFESLAAIGTDAPIARHLVTGASVGVMPVGR